MAGLPNMPSELVFVLAGSPARPPRNPRSYREGQEEKQKIYI